MSFFESVSQLPEDPIFATSRLFVADLRPNKVNLGIGTYADGQGQAIVLQCVKKAKEAILTKEFSNTYLPIQGDPQFLKGSLELVFGKTISETLSENIFAAQSLGGTGALRLGGEFLAQETSKTIFLPSPTWVNHKAIFSHSNMKLHSYRSYDEIKHKFDFAGMYVDISNMPPGSTILMHANCQNPTGIDPSFEQWQELSQLIKKQKILPFFDFAYQGFAENVEKDAQVIRFFVSQGHEILVANSFSKNFGLYSERLGSLFIVTHHREAAHKVGSQIKQIIRSNYSSPPRHGAQIVSHILENNFLKSLWLDELDSMRNRINEMRLALLNGLQSKNSFKDWSFLSRQKGFFSFCGLNEAQVYQLIKDFAIYMPINGRINVAGLNESNLNYVIDALAKVTRV